MIPALLTLLTSFQRVPYGPPPTPGVPLTSAQVAADTPRLREFFMLVEVDRNGSPSQPDFGGLSILPGTRSGPRDTRSYRIGDVSMLLDNRSDLVVSLHDLARAARPTGPAANSRTREGDQATTRFPGS